MKRNGNRILGVQSMGVIERYRLQIGPRIHDSEGASLFVGVFDRVNRGEE